VVFTYPCDTLPAITPDNRGTTVISKSKMNILKPHLKLPTSFINLV